MQQYLQTSQVKAMSSDGGNPQREELNTKELLEKFQNLLKDCSPDKTQTVTEMTRIANSLDRVEKGTAIASVASSSVGILGGITTIVGIALAPVTFGASLIVTVVGISVATVAGATGLSAAAAKHILSNKNLNKVKAMMEKIEIKTEEMEKCLNAINRMIGRLERTSRVDDDENMTIAVGAMAGRSVYTATELSRLAPLFRLSASAARGIRVAGTISGVLAGIFIAVDAVFIVKGAIDLSKGAKSELAEKIRNHSKNLEETFKQLEDIGKDLETCINEMNSFTVY